MTISANMINALLAFAFGCAITFGFSNVAFLRDWLPLSSDMLACYDIDSFVQHTARIPDFRYHRVIFGIHRETTVNAINELYDRAHCSPSPADAAGRVTYKTIRAQIIPDTY